MRAKKRRPKMKGRRGDWQIEDMIEMRLGGATYRAIGRRYGLCVEYVRHLLLFQWRSDRRRVRVNCLGDLEIMLGVNVDYRKTVDNVAYRK